jgi:hypothetical protein
MVGKARKHQARATIEGANSQLIRTLKLFCVTNATTMAFHIVNVIFIWEKDDNLHLGRIDHR